MTKEAVKTTDVVMLKLRMRGKKTYVNASSLVGCVINLAKYYNDPCVYGWNYESLKQAKKLGTRVPKWVMEWAKAQK